MSWGMLSRRIIAISPDKAVAKQITTALKAAGGTVETHGSLEPLGRGELQVGLVVVHLDGEMAGMLAEIVRRLAGDAKLIAILPAADLATTVDLMQVSDRVVGVMAADGLDVGELAAMTTRVLAGDIFGLEKLMPWGTRIHSTVVGDYQEKSLAISQLGEYAELMGVRRKFREAIEQSVDEMLMNALYDAPVDEHGAPLFTEIPTKSRVSLRVEQKVVVQYACDGKQLAVSVRDAFGTLERSTVLRYLYKCLHSEQQIDRKTGGAGLGLYLMASSSSRLLFNVLPGVATEAVTCVKLDSPKIQLEEIGFFTEKIDAGGRLAAGPSRRLPAGTAFPVERRAPGAGQRNRVVIGFLAAAIVVLLASIAVVAYPRLAGAGKTAVTFTTDPPGATIAIDGRARGVTDGGKLTVDGLTVGKAYAVLASLDGYEPAQTVVEASEKTPAVPLVLLPRAATVTVETDPPGATVMIEGKDVGQTPSQLTNLPPRTRVTVTLHRDGYVEAVQAIEVPAPGKEARVVIPLALSSDFATVTITSDPPGAKVLRNGELIPGVVTPTDELMVEAGKTTQFTLDLAGHVAEVIDARPARGTRRNALTATLAVGVPIEIKSNVTGRATVDGAPGCKRSAVPLDCIARPGEYSIEFEGELSARGVRKVDTRKGPASVTFSFGFIEGKDGAKFKLSSKGKAMSKVALEDGKRTVHVIDEDGTTSPVQVTVTAGKTALVP
jgi:hypothetical protein